MFSSIMKAVVGLPLLSASMNMIVSASPIMERSSALAVQCNLSGLAKCNAIDFSTTVVNMVNLNEEYSLPASETCCSVPNMGDTSFALCNMNEGGEGPLVTRQKIQTMASLVTDRCPPGPLGNLNGQVFELVGYYLLVSAGDDEYPTCACAGDDPNVAA